MYDAMQFQLKKIFGDKDSELAKASGVNVIMESETFYGEADDAVEDVCYQRNQPLNRRYNNNNSSNNNKNRGRSKRSRRGRSYGRGVLKRHKNPVDFHGNISRCRICESINHWEDNCPDNPYGNPKVIQKK